MVMIQRRRRVREGLEKVWLDTEEENEWKQGWKKV